MEKALQVPPGIIRCFPLSSSKIPKFLVWIQGHQMPPFLTFHFSQPSRCTFFQPKIVSFYPPPRLSHFSESQNVCVHLETCLPSAVPFGGQTSASDSSRCAAPSFSPWLQKRLHSLAKISPIMSTWAGHGVPSAAGAAAPGPPPRRWPWGTKEKPTGTTRRQHWLAEKPRSAAQLPVRKRRAKSLPESPLFESTEPNADPQSLRSEPTYPPEPQPASSPASAPPPLPIPGPPISGRTGPEVGALTSAQSFEVAFPQFYFRGVSSELPEGWKVGVCVGVAEFPRVSISSSCLEAVAGSLS